MTTCLSLPCCPSHLMLPCSRGDNDSRFLSILLPRPQGCSLLSNGFILALRSDFQVLCVCQALGMQSGKSQALSLGLRVHMKCLATHGRWQVCRQLSQGHCIDSNQRRHAQVLFFSVLEMPTLWASQKSTAHPLSSSLDSLDQAQSPASLGCQVSADSRASLPVHPRSILHRHYRTFSCDNECMHNLRHC